MSTIRLTMAQAVARFLTAQKTEIDGQVMPLFGGVWAIFGHGNVAGMGEALHGVREQLLAHLFDLDPGAVLVRRLDGQADALADPDVADVGVAERRQGPLDHAPLGVEDARPVADLDAGFIGGQPPTPYQSSKLFSVSSS